MKLLFTAAALVVSALNVYSQAILTNEDIVKMTTAGLAAEIINAKIRASNTKFDTSTDALLRLSTAKVPDSVVIVMVEKEQKEQERRSIEEQSNKRSLSEIPEQGSLKDVIGKKHVFVSSEYLKGRDNIVKEITKDGTFKAVDKIEDADFVITYAEVVRVRSVTATANTYGNNTTASAREQKERVGVIRLLMPSTTPGIDRARLIYEVTKIEFWAWDDHPAKSGARQFIKDLKKASSSN